ncbi:MAG: transcriptional repressor [Bacteroidota bacterium]
MVGHMQKTIDKKAVFLSWLKKSNTPISASDLYVRMRNAGMKVSITTVYRYLNLLYLDGVVKVIESDSKTVLFYI